MLLLVSRISHEFFLIICCSFINIGSFLTNYKWEMTPKPLFIAIIMTYHTWLAPFTCVISGPTGSGKSVFVQRLLKHIKTVVCPDPEWMLYCYGIYQEIFSKCHTTTEPCSYLFLDHKSDIDEKLRLKASIFPNDNHNYVYHFVTCVIKGCKKKWKKIHVLY